MPREYIGDSFSNLFRALIKYHGMIAIGVLRDRLFLGNSLPFVYTNPVAALLCLESDLLFVLSSGAVVIECVAC